MNDLWESWVSGVSVEHFLEEVDRAVAEGLFTDRRAAFIDYAEHALAQKAFAYWGPYGMDDSCCAEKLADQLLRHASKVEQQAREGNALWVD